MIASRASQRLALSKAATSGGSSASSAIALVRARRAAGLYTSNAHRPTSMPTGMAPSSQRASFSTYRSYRSRPRPRSIDQQGAVGGAVYAAAAAPFSILSWLGLKSDGGSEGSEEGPTKAASDAPVDGELPSSSSTLKYAASDAALRQASSGGADQLTLVFLSINAPAASSQNYIASKEWIDWIGYFREQGYDCLHVNVVDKTLPAGVSARALHKREESISQLIAKASGNAQVGSEAAVLARLASELEAQVRLQMLPRGAILFTRGLIGARVASEQTGSSNPHSSALIWLLDGSSAQDASAREKIKEKLPAKTRTLQVVSNEAAQAPVPAGKNVTVVKVKDVDSQKAIREVESWLIGQGY